MKKQISSKLVFFSLLSLINGLVALAQGQSMDTSAVMFINRAYELLGSNKIEATRLFHRALEIEPNNLLALRQLAYLSVSDKDRPRALELFQSSERVQSSDTIKLQIAYLLTDLGKKESAKSIFVQLTSSSDSLIRLQAEAGMREELPTREFQKTWPRVYGEIFYESRWKSTFFNINFQIGKYLGENERIGAYGVAALSTDTKSSGGAVPTIISDNTFLLGAGMRFNLLKGLFAEVQEGAAYYLIARDSSSSRIQNDFRMVAFYGNGIYAPFELHPEARMPLSLFGDVYSSAGYYARYHNSIGYLTLRGGARALELSHSVVDAYALGRLALDTKHEFYNNIFEIGGGFRWSPDVRVGVHLIFEYTHGMYLNVSDDAEREREKLYEPTYNTVRLMLIVDNVF